LTAFPFAQLPKLCAAKNRTRRLAIGEQIGQAREGLNQMGPRPTLSLFARATSDSAVREQKEESAASLRRWIGQPGPIPKCRAIEPKDGAAQSGFA